MRNKLEFNIISRIFLQDIITMHFDFKFAIRPSICHTMIWALF